MNAELIYLSVMVCVFIVASSFQALGEEWTAEQKEAIETVRAIWEAFKDGDVEAIMARVPEKSQHLFFTFF